MVAKNKKSQFLARVLLLAVFLAAGCSKPTAPICESPNLPAVHALLGACFDDMSPLDAWYPDVSHRLRHDCAKIATIYDGDTIVSTAMTVAETDTAALIGQVAKDSRYRGRGYAKACINSLILRCEGKRLYILPMTDIARSIYESMGFVSCDEWQKVINLAVENKYR